MTSVVKSLSADTSSACIGVQLRYTIPCQNDPNNNNKEMKIVTGPNIDTATTTTTTTINDCNNNNSNSNDKLHTKSDTHIGAGISTIKVFHIDANQCTPARMGLIPPPLPAATTTTTIKKVLSLCNR